MIAESERNQLNNDCILSFIDKALNRKNERKQILAFSFLEVLGNENHWTEPCRELVKRYRKPESSNVSEVALDIWTVKEF